MEWNVNPELHTIADKGTMTAWIKGSERKTERRDRQLRATRRMKFNINYEMLAPLVIPVITLSALSLQQHRAHSAVGTVMGRPFVQATLIELSTHTHTHAATITMSHADKSFFFTCNSHTFVHQFVNCCELHTREGQLKMHWELEKQASTGFSQGEPSRRQRDRENTDRETDRWDIGLSLRELGLVLTLLQLLKDTPHYTHTETHTQTHRGMIILLVPCLRVTIAGRSVFVRVWELNYINCVCALCMDACSQECVF